MPTATLEHANITVPDARKTADMLCRGFGWHIRWQGPAIDGGTSIHVGSPDSYLAIYTPKEIGKPSSSSYTTVGGLNHIGIVVNDLTATEALVNKEGYKPHLHSDYEPGRRFYFNDHDGIEFEVVSYTP